LPRLRSLATGVAALLLALAPHAALLPARAGEAVTATRQLLVVSAGYWRGRDARRFTFDVYDLDAGGKHIHRAEPGDVGEIRGMCCTPSTQRLYVAGHEGLLCYGWPGYQLVWRRPVEGDKREQNDAIAITRDGARIFTVRHFSKGMNVYDAASGERLRVIHEDQMPMWGRFSQVTHDGQRLFASNGDIFIINPLSEAIVGRFKPLSEPVRFALTPDGKRFLYATGGKRSLAIHDTAQGKLLHEIAVPAWEGAITQKQASVHWMALHPDGRQAWACDHINQALHRFDLAADPPHYAGRIDAPGTGRKDDQGLMYSVDGRFLVTGSGAILDSDKGTIVGHLSDENGQPCRASNSMLALEVDRASGRMLQTNQQCAPKWPGGSRP
jgi:sugar lactone lactonase YvrE